MIRKVAETIIQNYNMAQDEDVDVNEELEHDVTKEDIEANTDDTPTDDNGDAKE